MLKNNNDIIKRYKLEIEIIYNNMLKTNFDTNGTGKLISSQSAIYVGNLDSHITVEDICKFFGSKSTTYLYTYCLVDFPLNQQTQETNGDVYAVVLNMFVMN